MKSMIIGPTGTMPTSAALGRIAADICDRANAAGILWCGRATTALYWALRANDHLRQRMRTEVVLPAVNCLSVGYGVMLAGGSPRIADIQPATGLSGLAELKARVNPSTGAVMVTHLYGGVQSSSEIAKWCRDNEIMLIEDAAHALGGHFSNGSPVGVYGDVTLFSFNHRKIIDSGGGALLVRSRPLWDALRDLLASAPPPLPTDQWRRRLLEESVWHMEHGAVAAFRANVGARRDRWFTEAANDLKSIYLVPFGSEDKLIAQWNELPANLSQRFAKAECYENELRGGAWTFLNGWHTSGVCWRFSLLVDFPEQLLSFIEKIRSHGALASNLYWPLSEFFRPDDECPAAQSFAKRVLNLCVDASVSLEYVREQARKILQTSQAYMA
jgi:dTDP-4-amino-4,6-dideoxygalactose transaminase